MLDDYKSRSMFVFNTANMKLIQKVGLGLGKEPAKVQQYSSFALKDDDLFIYDEALFKAIRIHVTSGESRDFIFNEQIGVMDTFVSQDGIYVLDYASNGGRIALLDGEAKVNKHLKNKKQDQRTRKNPLKSQGWIHGNDSHLYYAQTYEPFVYVYDLKSGDFQKRLSVFPNETQWIEDASMTSDGFGSYNRPKYNPMAVLGIQYYNVKLVLNLVGRYIDNDIMFEKNKLYLFDFKKESYKGFIDFSEVDEIKKFTIHGDDLFILDSAAQVIYKYQLAD